MEQNNYYINKVYQKLQPPIGKVNWGRLVWSRHVLPKTRFIIWIAFLNTQDQRPPIQIGCNPK